MQVDIDKLLRRRLYLQRYVTSLQGDVREANAASDRRLVAMLSEFSLVADERAVAALIRQRTSNADAQAVLSGMRQIVNEQRHAVTDLLSEQLPQLVEREAVVTAAAIEEESPSMLGVASLPIAGLLLSRYINATYQRFANRLLADVSQAASLNPATIATVVRGSRAENYRNGLLFWRDSGLQRDLDVIVNGAASNAANHVYVAAGVEKVNFLATLDFRTCPRCYAAETGSPYAVGSAPFVPVHPRCRCLLVPHLPDTPSPERPFVKDDRSVKDIPKHERPARIGQTRDTIEQFFNRMTKAQRRDYMGPSRAELWEQGKIKDVRELVNQRTLRPLRLDELPEL